MTTDPDSHLQPPRNQPPAGTAPPPVMDQAFDRESLYLLRASLAAHARKAGLPPARVDTVVIAVHELAANAVRHGAGHGRLRVWQHHQALHCEVSDDGVPRAAGSGPDGAAPPDAPPWRAVPGHGLWLARRLADHASVQTGPHGTVATVGFALRPGPRIGFIGVGRMGLPMCVNLVRAGYEVTAGDARAERESAVAGCGARWRGTAAEVAAEADVLITVLPGPGEVYEAMAGPGGAIAALPPTATWIDMTSSSPAVGRVLLTSARARGIEVLEAPAGGGVPEARAGTLQLFVGGDSALVERHRALLEVLADPGRITHVGGPGAGYLAKLLVNLLWFGVRLRHGPP